MHRLIYVSTTTPAFNEGDIDAILAAARERNAATDVTSLLLHMDSDFLQVLEGPRRAVEDVFRSIGRDHRHGAVTTMLSRPTETRDFPDLPLGYEQLTETPDTEAIYRMTRAALASSLPGTAGLECLAIVRAYVSANLSDLAA